MKKIVTLALLLCGVCSGIFAQNIDQKEKALFKKCKVTTETVMGYETDEYGKATLKGIKKSMRTFDKKGNTATIVEYNIKSAPIKRTVLKYNSDEVVIGALVYKGYDDELIDKYKITYDANGNKTSRKGMLASNEYEITYTYNSANQLTKKEKKKAGVQVYVYNYSYNNKLLIKEEYSSTDFELTKSFEYNDQNQLVKESYRTYDLPGSSFVYSYDSAGNKVTETEYNVHGELYESYSYVYGDKGEIKKISKYNMDSVEIMRWKYSYDYKGILDQIKIYDGDMESAYYITKYIYKFRKED